MLAIIIFEMLAIIIFEMLAIIVYASNHNLRNAINFAMLAIIIS